MIKIYYMWGWRYGSEVKNNYYFCRGSGFRSQHPHSNSQLLITSVPGYPKFSFDFIDFLMHMLCLQHLGNTTHINTNKYFWKVKKIHCIFVWKFQGITKIVFRIYLAVLLLINVWLVWIYHEVYYHEYSYNHAWVNIYTCSYLIHSWCGIAVLCAHILIFTATAKQLFRMIELIS